jgi:hypothetical protein
MTETANGVPIDHSVTCVICGELADERETAVVTSDLEILGPEMIIENPLRYGAIQQLVHDNGAGEAHMDCFHEYYRDYACEQIEAFEEAHA